MLDQNRQLLQESAKFETPSRSDSSPRFFPDRMSSRIADDRRHPGPIEDVTYLTAPILSADSIAAANKEAKGLEERGQKGLAAKIRLRIQEACKDEFGLVVSPAKFVCLTSAAELDKHAFRCERAGAYPMAAKLYERAATIYQDEIHSTAKVASVTGYLARVYAEDNQIEKAKQAYVRAMAGYDKHPAGLVEDNEAAFLEQYAGFLDKYGTSTEAAALYKRAAEVRKREYSRRSRH